MRVGSALLVDEIRDRDDGSIDLIGLREDLYFDAVPVILERLTLFIELEVGADDRGKQHALEFRISEADTNKPIAAAPIKFTLPPDYPRPVAPLDPTLFETTFHRFGLHTIDIFIGGDHARRLFLRVLPRDKEN